jgi:hypothetical protein
VLLEDMLLAVRRRLCGFSALCGRCPAVVEHNISRKVDLTTDVDYMTS